MDDEMATAKYDAETLVHALLATYIDTNHAARSWCSERSNSAEESFQAVQNRVIELVADGLIATRGRKDG